MNSKIKYPNDVVVKKTWGHEMWLHRGKYCLKLLRLVGGSQSSLHMHRRKTETLLVISGKVLLEVGKRQIEMGPGDHADICAETYHRFKSLTKTSLVVEASTPHSEDDVVRREEPRAC